MFLEGGAEESNLQVGTFRSLALPHLESKAHSGGVGEAGLGWDQPQAVGVQDDDGLGQAGATDQEVNWWNDEMIMNLLFL